MLGRGVDQVLPHPGDPRLYEGFAKSALDYVALAERVNGAVPRMVAWEYVWGAALEEMQRAPPDAFIINLETAITENEDFEPKGVNYRMHPANAPCLAAGGVDCCVIANNHILDWGRVGLADTLHALSIFNVQFAGAGETESAAAAPAVIKLGPRGRILVFAFATPTSGVPADWAASEKPGVNFLPDLSPAQAARIAEQVRIRKRVGDIVIASIHWGSNWGYDVPRQQQRFARALIDEASVDIIHGHSSHHPKALELHNGRPVLYGCGDFINDYEGIPGHESFRTDLTLLYLLSIDASDGRLLGLDLVSFRLRKFRLNRPSAADIDWLEARLRSEYQRFGLDLEPTNSGRFALHMPR